MSVINTNITSMISQSNLNKSKGALTTAMERLSSGMRINSAKDDAAGQAIANRMTSQVKGLAQAQRNANDGISVAQTAEGALNQVNDNLQRIRELAVQASNDTNSRDDRASIQAEINQRLSEINRISQETNFNGTKVLNENQTLKIQVGANDGEAINVSLQEISASTLGLAGFRVSGDEAVTLNEMVRDFSATGTKDIKVGATTYQVTIGAGTVKDATGTNDVYKGAGNGAFLTDVGNTAVTTGAGADATAIAALADGLAEGQTFDWNGTTWTVSGGAADVNGNGSFTSKVNGQDITLTIANSTAPAGTAAELTVTGATLYKQGTTTPSTTVLTTYATNDAATESDLMKANGAFAGADLAIGGTNYTVDAAGAVFDDTSSERVYVKNAGTATAALALASEANIASRDPLKTLDAALKTVDSLRSDLGAIQNRFESAITNLQTNETNLSAARSRIEDADYAKEVANMTRAQILQQAGTSVLAQANQVPQGVLSLLR